MKLNKVTYRVVDRLGWSGWNSLEEFAAMRSRVNEGSKQPIKRILKITEEEMDPDELMKFKKETLGEDV